MPNLIVALAIMAFLGGILAIMTFGFVLFVVAIPVVLVCYLVFAVWDKIKWRVQNVKYKIRNYCRNR